MGAATDPHPTLVDVLSTAAGGGTVPKAVARAVDACCTAAVEIGDRVAASPLGGDLDDLVGTNADGDAQRALDLVADGIARRHLADAGVAALVSEEGGGIEMVVPGSPVVVAIDPLDGSANLAINASSGLIFSVRPAGDDPVEAFLRPGTEQLAAGAVLFGPATVLALTTGDGTDLYTLDPVDRSFVRTARRLRIAGGTPEYAINASNARHWPPAVRSYVSDLLAGADGPRDRNFNMRWLGALVGDVVRILLRGGIYLYPGDRRPTHSRGRLRLLYEAHPTAMLIEQAGGAATDGRRRILDLVPTEIHERTPLVFGSADKVERFARYLDELPHTAERAPLFGRRGLFREG